MNEILEGYEEYWEELEDARNWERLQLEDDENAEGYDLELEEKARNAVYEMLCEDD